MTSRTYAYCRVSTTEQDTDNQILAIRKAGWDIEPQRVVSEQVSGSVEAFQRPAFRSLVEHKLEAGDALVVLKLDRLGRDNIDLQNTITTLTDRGIRVVCLDLPVSDLSTSEGKLMLQLFSSFAEFERNRIRERTAEGLEKARANGVSLGRPTGSKHAKRVQELKSEGLSQNKVAKALGVSVMTVKRHWNV